MSSASVCSACLRPVRRQWCFPLERTRNGRPSTPPLTLRTFVTSRQLRAAGTPQPSPRKPPPPPPSPRQSTPPPSSGAIANFAAQLRKTEALRGTTEPYVAYGGTEDLFLECSRQCNYTVPSALADPPAEPPKTSTGEELGEGSGWWLDAKARGGLGLPVTFNAWAQVVFLHMWMLTVRLRGFPEKYVRNWHQNLLDHFFYAAEDRMATWHRMVARSERNKHLKELWTQWRGVMLSYDEGLIKGDAVMAAALWRNVFKADQNVDMADLALVTAYVMRELQRLGNMDDETVATGNVKFGDPKEVPRGLVGKESEWSRKPVSPEELRILQEETTPKTK